MCFASIWSWGPRALHTKLQKNAVIFHTHYNFFPQLQQFFPTVLFIDHQFSQRFFDKNLCSFVCSVGGPWNMFLTYYDICYRRYNKTFEHVTYSRMKQHALFIYMYITTLSETYQYCQKINFNCCCLLIKEQVCW